MFRVLPWLLVMLVLCATGCPSTGSSTDAAADRGLVDVATDQASDASAELGADADECPPGQSRSCRCGDSGVGGAVCTDAGVLGACDCSGRPPELPPRLLTPHSVSRATTQRPTFRWVLPDGVTHARVTLARDRALTREARSETVTGASWRPTAALAFGVWFWRVEGLGDDGGTAWTSVTWEFRAPRRDTPVDSSWGTLRDFNGDGYDDFVVNNVGERRGLAVFLGSSVGVPRTPNQLVAVSSPESFREKSPRVGDFNGDGLADLAVPIDFPDRTFESLTGAVDVYLGAHNGIREMPTVRVYPPLQGVPRWNFFGDITVGDVDGDGLSDLAVGIQPQVAAAYSQPQVTIYPGSNSGVSTTPTFQLGTDGARITERMNVIGDFNDDGYTDLLSPWVWLRADGTPSGSYFISGRPRGFPIVAERTLVPWDRYGLSIGWGDLDGNGRCDAVVGSRDTVEIYQGGSTLRATMPDQILLPPDRPSGIGRLYGSSVSSSTDVNGDGFSDLLVGAPEASYGTLYLYAGQSGTPPTSLIWHRTGFDVGGFLHTDDSSSGLDVNGDGFDDIVTESYVTSPTDRLSIIVFAGSEDFRATEPSWTIDNYRGLVSQ